MHYPDKSLLSILSRWKYFRNIVSMKLTWDAFIYVNCMDKSYLRCFDLCFKRLNFLHEKIITVLIIVYCFDESYLGSFICFKCLKFLHKIIIILIINYPDSLNIYTTFTCIKHQVSCPEFYLKFSSNQLLTLCQKILQVYT